MEIPQNPKSLICSGLARAREKLAALARFQSTGLINPNQSPVKWKGKENNMWGILFNESKRLLFKMLYV